MLINLPGRSFYKTICIHILNITFLVGCFFSLLRLVCQKLRQEVGSYKLFFKIVSEISNVCTKPRKL